MMALTLIGSFTSPYVRKIRLLLWSDKTVIFHPLNYLEEEGNKYLKSVNPLNQIPMLLDGDTPIYDSRVMFNYISKKWHLPELSIADENILSIIDTAMASGVNLFSLRKGGVDITDKNNYFLLRQQERIPTLIKHLIPWASKQDPTKDWNFLTMSLVSLLYWLQLREIYSVNIHPELIDFMQRFSQCPGVIDTEAPPV
jgi:glutathione S-transferase